MGGLRLIAVNAQCDSTILIYYSSTHFLLFDQHYYLILMFLFCSHLFSSHISFLMADANAIYLSPKPYYLLLINTLRIILSSLLFTTHRLSLFLFLFSFWFSSHISIFSWLMLMPYIYHPSRIIYYSSTHFVLFHHHYYLLLIITVYFYFVFFLLPHTSLLMADANAMYHPSFIMYYSSTHYLFTYYFLINPFFPPWMVDVNFIFILVFTSSYFCFILRMRHGLFILSHFIYNVLPLLYTFSSFMFIPHCKYFLSCIFFFKVHAPGIWLISHNVVNTRSQSRTHRLCTSRTRPVRQMPFRVETIEDIQKWLKHRALSRQCATSSTIHREGAHS